MKVLIITGGNSSEREISLISANEVKKALDSRDHQTKLFDLKQGQEKLKEIIPDFDVIFPVLHGEEGEGGELQKFLSEQGKPFVGGNWQGFKQGWHKIPFKKFCDQNNIATAKWQEIQSKKDILNFGFPCVLKSSNGGSSKEVLILKSENYVQSREVQQLLKSDLPLYIEELLTGTEVTVGILNDRALPVIEIVPPKGEWFDYQNKYTGKTQEIPDAPSLTESQRQEVQEIALKIHRTFNLGPYSRIDFIFVRNQALLIVQKNIPYVLEVNTIPGLTPESLFPKAAKAIGLNFPELMERLIKLATN